MSSLIISIVSFGAVEVLEIVTYPYSYFIWFRESRALNFNRLDVVLWISVCNWIWKHG
jgi:hypothetical protein